jgi:hypothetical protein
MLARQFGCNVENQNLQHMLVILTWILEKRRYNVTEGKNIYIKHKRQNPPHAWSLQLVGIEEGLLTRGYPVANPAKTKD